MDDSYVRLIEMYRGIRGVQGPKGVQGPAGPKGLPGPYGLTGPPGEIGLRGVDGDIIVVSSPAFTGESRITGATGPTGPTGPQGISLYGETGDTGPKGEKGPKGEIGDKGEAGGGDAYINLLPTWSYGMFYNENSMNWKDLTDSDYSLLPFELSAFNEISEMQAVHVDVVSDLQNSDIRKLSTSLTDGIRIYRSGYYLVYYTLSQENISWAEHRGRILIDNYYLNPIDGSMNIDTLIESKLRIYNYIDSGVGITRVPETGGLIVIKIRSIGGDYNFDLRHFTMIIEYLSEL